MVKDFKTITKYQLLFLARSELLKRLDRIKSKMSKSKDGELSRRDRALFSLYSEQIAEINERMDELSFE